MFVMARAEESRFIFHTHLMTSSRLTQILLSPRLPQDDINTTKTGEPSVRGYYVRRSNLSHIREVVVAGAADELVEGARYGRFVARRSAFGQIHAADQLADR